MSVRTARTAGASRPDLVADAALALLAGRGMRGLTHRAVDEAAGLPQGSTSNVARTRQALLELAVRRLAEREARVLGLHEMPDPRAGAGPLTDAMALATHRALSRNRELTLARYELALEATADPSCGPISTRPAPSSASCSPAWSPGSAPRTRTGTRCR